MFALMAAVVALFWVATGWASSPEYKVTASGYEKANIPSNAIDDDPLTHWTCRGECWIEIDQGYVGITNNIYIGWLNTKRENFFDIATSTDGVNWTTVFKSDVSENTGTEFGEYEFDPDLTGPPPPPDGLEEGEFWPPGYIEARYFRVIGHGNSNSDHNSIVELREWSFDQEEFMIQHDIVAATASAHNKTNTPERAIDDNLATHWTSDNGEWIQLDLGYLDTVENVKIAWLSGNKRKADYDIEVSMDGVNWELAFAGTSTGASLKLENNLFGKEYCARYVRIYGYGNDHPTQGSKNSITEVEIWGYTRNFGFSCEEEASGEIEAIADRQ